MTNIMKMRSRAGKTLPIILAACVLVSVGAGVGVGMVLSKKAQASPAKEKKHEEVEPALVHSLGEMVVNLADTESLRYVKVTVAVGLKDKLDEEKLKEMSPIMRDSVINVLTRKTFKELHKAGGPAKAKEEILHEIEENAHGVVLTKVYFEGFAMQ